MLITGSFMKDQHCFNVNANCWVIIHPAEEQGTIPFRLVFRGRVVAIPAAGQWKTSNFGSIPAGICFDLSLVEEQGTTVRGFRCGVVRLHWANDEPGSIADETR